MLSFIVRLSFVIAVSGGVLIAGIAKIFGLLDYVNYGLFGFFSILFVYNGQRLYKASANSKVPTLRWIYVHRRSIFVLTIISFFLAAYFLFQISHEVTKAHILIFGVSALLTFFYVMPFRGKNIRDRPHLKAHATALTWTVIIVVFPIMNGNVTHNYSVILFIIALYCYFLAITVSFDIRDLKYDLPTQRTIPQVVGTSNAKTIGILLLIISTVFTGIASMYYMINPLFMIAYFVQMLLVAFASNRHHDFYFSALMDGSVSLLGISFLLAV